MIAQWCTHWDVEVWAFCLTPNHIHLRLRYNLLRRRLVR
ncbi:MAG: hypothetical protein K8F34_05460 [Candidatus Kuenenia stuttgartiensis]|nr:hypothetical protein [Candidatus Kuenenia stuttgartiensis]MCL4727811.1 hypothetical protein [Candidatus Kuenenia stuttgartiensis]